MAKSLREELSSMKRKIRCIQCNDNNSGIGGIQSIQAGENVSIDNTDPLNPIVSATGGGSSDLTLEQARQNGNVLEGDVNIPISDETKFIGFIGNNIPFGSDFKLGYFIDIRSEMLLFGQYIDINNFWGIQESLPSNGVFVIKGVKNGIEYQFDLSDTIQFGTSNENSKGIVGGYEFNKQGDRKAFAQLSDVYDNVASKVLDTRDNSSKTFWTGSQAQYDAIVTKNPNTIYIIL